MSKKRQKLQRCEDVDSLREVVPHALAVIEYKVKIILLYGTLRRTVSKPMTKVMQEYTNNCNTS